jgi:hypothetical protein
MQPLPSRYASVSADLSFFDDAPDKVTWAPICSSWGWSDEPVGPNQSICATGQPYPYLHIYCRVTRLSKSRILFLPPKDLFI